MDRESTTKPLSAGKSIDDIRKLIDEGRESLATMGLSKSHSTALKRGASLVERQSAWPFDYYQCTNWNPVDYTYWTRDIKTDIGQTQLITMHAQCYTEEGETFPADQVSHRGVLREAHRKATGLFLDAQKQQTTQVALNSKRDEWGALQRQILPHKILTLKNTRRR